MTVEVRRRLLELLWSRLRCPACRRPMSVKSMIRELVCEACRVRYPVLPHGVRIMLEPGRAQHSRQILSGGPEAQRMVAEYRGFGAWRGKTRNAIKPPSIVYGEDVARRYA